MLTTVASILYATPRNNRTQPRPRPLVAGYIQSICPRPTVQARKAPTWQPPVLMSQQEGARPQPASQDLEVDVDRGLAHSAIAITPPATCSRDVFFTEQMDMHLVWTTSQISFSPISVATYTLGATANTTGAKDETKSVRKYNGGLRTYALGFLFSYTALITYESDFKS